MQSSPELEMTMRKSIVLAPILLTAILSLSVALADRIKERASQDRLSFGDPGVTELLAK